MRSKVYYLNYQRSQTFKAIATGKALLKRIEDELIKQGHEPFTETLLHCTPPVGVSTPECVMRMTVRHNDRDALKFFGVELATAGTSMAPGLQGGVGGRPRPFPVLEYESVLIDKTEITPTLTIDGEDIEGNINIEIITNFNNQFKYQTLPITSQPKKCQCQENKQMQQEKATFHMKLWI